MLKSSRLFKRKAAGMMAAVMMIGILPVNMNGFADVFEMPPDSYDNMDEHTATRSNASLATASDAQKAQELQEEGTVYYVDAKNGNDSGDGKTEETAWKTFDRVNSKTFLPGDKILLKADCIWNQALNPKGSGREGAPITIDTYGEGSRPVINGNGTSGPSITGAVTIYNEEYWEIYNLEVTNLENTDKMGEAMDSGTSERAGILIYSSNQKKIYKHITVKNCYVHDVNSNFKGGKTSGGIIVMGHYLDKDGKRVTIDENGNLTAKAMGRAAFEDVLIEGNYVKNVAIEGIRNKCNTDISGSGWGKNEFLKNYSNVTIRNNYLENVVGDGIVLTETKGGLIEGNMVNSSCGFDRGTVNYAQCWTMFADDVTVQYNEVYGNRYGYDDGEAFDSDMMNVDNIFQYNLSHDCGGGVMLFMASQKNTIFRYNLSINDGTGTYPGESRMQQQTFHYDNTTSAGPGVGKIYNNTIVLFGDGKKTSLFGGKSKRTCFVDFKNNIVLAKDGAVIDFAVLEQGSTIHSDSLIENNCFYPDTIANTSAGSVLNKESLQAKGNIFKDPMLIDYKAGKDYSKYKYPLEELEDLRDSDFTKDRIQKLAEPYQLTEGSPCIRAGQRIDGMPTEDIMGNTIAGRVDMGALEYSSEDELAEEVEEVHIVTTPGVVPKLPSTLKIVLDGKSYDYPVKWDELTKEDCMQAGVIELSGVLPGLSNQVAASIIIADAPERFEPVEVSTFAGIYPVLPDKITAEFAGGLTLELGVAWETLTLEQYSHEGEITAEGTVTGLKEKCQAKVSVIGELGDGTSVKETVASKDAYTQQSDGNKAYGSSDPNVIKVKTANNSPAYTRNGLIGFDLSGDEQMLRSASSITIKLQMTRPVTESDYKTINNHFYLKVYEVNDNWKEGTVTWNSSPDVSGDNLVIRDKKIVYTNIRDAHENIVELDVTDWVKNAYAKKGQTKFSFLMTTDYFGEYANGDNGGIDFASKEAGGKMAPALVLSNVYETEVESVSVSTPAGKMPVLPETVSVSYSNGEQKNVTVEWNGIDSANYQGEGNFVVYGKADGVKLPIRCTVYVMEALHKVVSVRDIPPIIQLVGTAWEELGLPKTAAALLDNGKEAQVPIEYWFPDNAYDPEKVFSYTCIGYLELTGHETIENPNQKFATVTVNMIEPEDKNALLVLYTEAADLINQGALEQLTDGAKGRFMKVFNQAASVLINTKASESEVHNAYVNLMEAIWSLDSEENLKPDTSALKDLVLIGESKNKKDYTGESYEVLKDALSEARSVLKDKTLTKEDQYRVDQAYDSLKEAIDGLEFNGNPGTENKIVTGIKIIALPNQTEYKTGERISHSGLSVAAVYNDGSLKLINGYEISDVNTSVPGVKDVVITYRTAVNNAVKVFTDVFQITVKKEASQGSGSGGSGGDGISGQWQKASGMAWRFLKPDKTYAANEWAKISGKWYRFNEDGMMQTGWIVDQGMWYRLGTEGSMESGWVKEESDGYWYFLDESGAMKTGWVLIYGIWYYFNPVTQGNTGWQKTEDGKWGHQTGESGSRPMGALCTNTTTADGYRVDENGTWIR
ncbi:MAG: Ig-like domain-containing protein [Hungatella sp.]|jgi:hypothetical protein|nr:Ig-like domain-containing protein [Hungatella sp.]